VLTAEQIEEARAIGRAKASDKQPSKEAPPAPEPSALDYLKTAGESAAAGALSIPGAVASLGATGLEAVGVISPETAQAARDASSGRAMVSSLVGAGTQIAGGNTEESAAAGEQAAAQYGEAARARAEAMPGTAFAGQIAGQIGGLALTGGLAAGEAGAGTAAALGGGLGARLSGAAVRTGIEGAALGLAGQQDEAWVKEQHLTGQQVLASVGFNGLLGGALGFAGGALTESLSAGKGALARLVGRAGESAEEAIEPAAARGASVVSGSDAAIGNTYRATTGEAAEKDMPRFYREIVEGKAPARDVTDKASKELYEHATAVEKHLSDVTDEVTRRDLKYENVAANFKRSPPPEGAVTRSREAALQTWDTVCELENGIKGSLAESLRAGGMAPEAAMKQAASKATAFTRLRVELGNGVKAIASTDDAATAYLEADQMRRDLLSTLDSVGKSAQASSDPLMRRVMVDASAKLDSTYRQAAEHLFDESVWGTQGASQRATNEAWVDFINARKNVFRGFADQTGEKLLSNGMKVPQFDMRESSLSKLVSDMSGPGARDASRRWTQYLDSAEKLTNAIGKGYELAGEKSAALADLNSGVQGVRSTVTRAASELKAIGQAERLLQTGRETHVEQHVGGIVGGALGAVVGGPVGAAVGHYAGKAAGAATSAANVLEHRVQLQVVADRVKRNVAGALDAYFGGMDRVAAGAIRAKNAVTGAARAVARASTRPAALAKASAMPTAIAALQGKARTPEEGYRKKAEQLAALTADNGKGIRDASVKALGPIAAHDPHMAAAFVSSATNAAEYLKAQLPTATVNPNSLTPFSDVPQPSRAELHEFAQISQAIDHPTEVLMRDLHQGTVSQPVIQAIKTVYPDLYEWVRNETLERIQQRDADGKSLPLRELTSLDTALDLGGAASPVLRPDFALQYGSGIAGKQQTTASRPSQSRSRMGDRMAPPTASMIGASNGT
jgi:hypothetical protein